MNTHRFDNELPLLRQKGRVLKAADVGIVASAVELLEAAKLEEKRKRQAMQKEWQRQQEAGFRSGAEEAKRQLVFHYWKTVASTVAYLEAMQDQIADAIVQGVRALIQSTPPPERAIQLATAAVDRLRQQAWIVLCLNPADVDPVNRLLENWKTQLPRSMRVETRASEEVKRGDCILESPIGQIDASLDLQIEIIQEQLKNTL